MLIAALQLELAIPWAMSLKDKRRAVKGLKERIRHRFKASTAEVGDLDLWRSAILGVVLVGTDARVLEGCCRKIVDYVEEFPNARLEDFALEII